MRAQIDSLEVLIDRTNHCDGCLPWPGNERIIKAMTEAQRQLRLALLFHEERAMERKVDRDGWMPEREPTGEDGHFRQLRDEVRALPPMTRRQAEEQRLDFTYGNLACSTNHKPRREVFKEIALGRGWTEEQFDKWADGREWWE